ncbi:4Fe-4S binding protein [Shewanella sp. GXUN23E]|uniref:4Fe-4S binding protein n=1 Tax=Shewanella sp. GXUN23E TaxID=3422498 RepID=UPI003D7D1479
MAELHTMRLILNAILLLLCSLLPLPLLAQWLEAGPEVLPFFPTATRIQSVDEMGLTPVYQLNELLGFVFESDELVNFPGFSGETINLRIGLDMQGVIRGVEVVRHHEPIFLHGLGEEPMLAFVAQYLGQEIKQRFIIGSHGEKMADGRTVYLDGITKATVSVMVINDTLLTAAAKVARARLDGFGDGQVATLNQDNYSPASFEQLVKQGAVFHWQLSLDEAARQLNVPGERLGAYLQAQNSAELNVDAKAVEDAKTSEGLPADAFIDITGLFVSSPLIGRNLLGEAEYQRLAGELAEGELAVMMLSRGAVSFVGEDFVAGTSPSRLGLLQHDVAVDLRDIDFYSFYSPSLAADVPAYRDIRVLKIQGRSGFNPGAPMTWQITLNLSNNPLLPRPEVLSQRFELPAAMTVPPPAAVKPEPLWRTLWRARMGEIALLLAYLLLLTALFACQRALSPRYGRYLPRVRLAALLFVIGFIGFYAQGQLSVVNIYTLALSLWKGFDIQVFLLDPIIFVLWSFVFVSLFLWGRGLFCGWLCPFGAMQELLGWLAQHFRLPQWRPAETLHRRLQLIKYPLLLLLLICGFYSLSLAETLAEVEPFKTAVTMNFVRHWPFVLYATALLLLGLFVHKFYCRYLCPLGAGLALLGRLRLFSWLRRRPECGNPCQLCRKACHIDAISADGRIDYNECIQCLDCLTIIDDSRRCVVDRYGDKRRKRAQNQGNGTIAIEIKTTEFITK